MAQTVCRSCNAPITWGESGTGKRTPFNADGRSHFETCPDSQHRSKGRSSSGQTGSPGRDVEIRRQVAMKCASELVAAALQSHEEAKVSMVFAVADRILAWLEGGDAAA